MNSIPDASSDAGMRRWLDCLTETVLLGDGRSLVLRPITPEDEAALFEFAAHVSPADTHFRFFRLMSKQALRTLLSRFCRIDYANEMAFIAVDPNSAPPMILGVIRAVKLPGSADAEFAIVIRSDMKGIGLGHQLMRKIVEYSRSAGTRRLIGEILPDNHPMLRLAGRFGFTLIQTHTDIVEAALDLRASDATPG
jgi:acetyltransferase